MFLTNFINFILKQFKHRFLTLNWKIYKMLILVILFKIIVTKGIKCFLLSFACSAALEVNMLKIDLKRVSENPDLSVDWPLVD